MGIEDYLTQKSGEIKGMRNHRELINYVIGNIGQFEIPEKSKIFTEVFFYDDENIGRHLDIVALHDNTIYLVEAKTANSNKKRMGCTTRDAEQQLERGYYFFKSRFNNAIKCIVVIKKGKSNVTYYELDMVEELTMADAERLKEK